MDLKEIESRAASLVSGEGWPLLRFMLKDDESAQLSVIYKYPLSEAASIAAVKLAHLEELKNMLRSAAKTAGDIFADEPEFTRPESAPEPEPDEYDLW